METGSKTMYDSTWFPNSGASSSVIADYTNLNSGTEYTGQKKLHMGNGSGIYLAYWAFFCSILY